MDRRFLGGAFSGFTLSSTLFAVLFLFRASPPDGNQYGNTAGGEAVLEGASTNATISDHQDLADSVTRFNELMKQKEYSDAEQLANHTLEHHGWQPITETMLHKARVANGWLIRSPLPEGVNDWRLTSSGTRSSK